MRRDARLRVGLGLLLLVGALVSAGPSPTSAEGFARRGGAGWDREVAEFERRDRLSPPPTGGVVFVGSSSIASWSTLARDMAPLATVNRGLGGTHFTHLSRYAPRIVVPYQPRAVVIYAGDNDLDEGTGKSAESVLEDFRHFTATVHEYAPTATIYVLAIKPSPSRWKRWREMRRGNALIAGLAHREPRIEFVDVATPMLGDDGEPRESLFDSDGLHLSSAGYALWTSVLRPILLRDLHTEVPAASAP